MNNFQVGDIISGQYLTDDWNEGVVVNHKNSLWFKWPDGDMRPLSAFKQIKLISRQTSLYI